MIQVGQEIPDVEVIMLGSPMPVRTRSLSGLDETFFVFDPVPFSRGCSQVHLPGYVENAETSGRRSFLACNAMGYGCLQQSTVRQVEVIPDGEGDFARALGMDMLGEPGFGCGMISQRYALITEDGVVTSVSVEDEPGIMQTSLAVMGRLQDTSWWKPLTLHQQLLLPLNTSGRLFTKPFV